MSQRLTCHITLDVVVEDEGTLILAALSPYLDVPGQTVPPSGAVQRKLESPAAIVVRLLNLGVIGHIIPGTRVATRRVRVEHTDRRLITGDTR